MLELGGGAGIPTPASPLSLPQQEVDKCCYELTDAVDRCTSALGDADRMRLLDLQQVRAGSDLMLAEVCWATKGMLPPSHHADAYALIHNSVVGAHAQKSAQSRSLGSPTGSTRCSRIDTPYHHMMFRD